MIRRGAIHTVRREDGASMALVHYQRDAHTTIVLLEVKTPEGDVHLLGLAQVIDLVEDL